MNSERFSAAILGCGAVVQDLYLPVLQGLAGELEIRACFDLDGQNARHVAAQLGAEAITGGLQNLLESNPTDGVLITLPNKLHADAIAACIGAGRHVLCEKPVATDTKECDRIERVLASTDRVLTVNLVRRCFPASEAMRHAVQSGVLGTLQRIEVSEGGRGGWQSRTGFQFMPDSSGGGVTLDRGSHIIDLLVNWCGTPLLTGYADDAAGGCEATSIADVSWSNGLSGVIKMSKFEPWPARVTVHGHRGMAQWTPAEPGAVRIFSLDEHGQSFESIMSPRAAKPDVSVFDSLATMFRRWIAACRGTQANPTPFEEVRVAIDLITQCYARRRPLQAEWLQYEE